MSIESSPLVKWSNSIPSRIVEDESIDEIRLLGECSYPLNTDLEKAFQKYIDNLLRRFVLELIKRYDPQVNRHTLKDLKVINLIAEPITFTDMNSKDKNMKFSIHGRHKLVSITEYEGTDK